MRRLLPAGMRLLLLALGGAVPARHQLGGGSAGQLVNGFHGPAVTLAG